MTDFLRDFATTPPVLPASINGLIALSQTRAALQSGAPDWAASTARNGIAVLGPSRQNISDEATAYRAALHAALTALLATAQKRSGTDAERQQENFVAADSAFIALVDSGQAMIAPFLSDYLLMLVEFGVTDRAFHVTEKLSSIVQRLGATDPRAASLVWLRAAMISPTPRMVLELGSSLLEQNDKARAIEEFMHAAAIALAGNEIPVALEAVEHVLGIDQDNADARRVRGVLRWRLGHIDRAHDDFVAASHSRPDDFDARLALARTYLRLGAPQEAQAELNVVSKAAPAVIDALWLQGEVELSVADEYRVRGRKDKAREHFLAAVAGLDTVLLRDPLHEPSRRARAIAFYRLDRLEDALLDLSEALKSYPNDVEAHGWHAAVLLDLKKNMEALAAANRALALTEADAPAGEHRAWLLGLKGRALLNSGRPEQAVEILRQAVYLNPGDQDLACNLLQAHKNLEDWNASAECAANLQKNPYGGDFLLRLRREEVLARRNLGEYEAAFAAMDRKPNPPANNPGMVWLHARLLADIGDFETVQTLLKGTNPDGDHFVDHLSLRGWAIQNLEAADRHQRTALGSEGSGFYRNSLEALPRERTEGVWLRKGLANALLRQDDQDEAFKAYKAVISECEERIKSSVTTPRILSLIGWCHHCMGDHATALRCYDAAIDRGEHSIAVELDHDLVVFAAAGKGRQTEGPDPVARYKGTIQRARKEETLLRRLGLLRVALHDLRELLFLHSESADSRSGEIGRLLCMELLEATGKIDARFDLLAEHVFDSLCLAMSEPMNIGAVERDALSLKIKAGLLIRKKRIPEAVKALQQAAQTYRELGLRDWLARTWRDISHLSQDQDPNLSCAAAGRALIEGIYEYDIGSGRALIAKITQAAVSKIPLPMDYASLIQKVFSDVGPDIAYLDASKILEGMTAQQRQLFVTTVSSVFPTASISPDSRWRYVVGDGQNIRQIPDIDGIMGPFLRERVLPRFKDVRDRVLA